MTEVNRSASDPNFSPGVPSSPIGRYNLKSRTRRQVLDIFRGITKEVTPRLVKELQPSHHDPKTGRDVPVDIKDGDPSAPLKDLKSGDPSYFTQHGDVYQNVGVKIEDIH